jgi:hypothetical protein
MIEKILKLMESRRKHRHKARYRENEKKLDKRYIWQTSGYGKNIWKLKRSRRNNNLHKRVEEIAGISVKRTSSLVDKKGRIILEVHEKLKLRLSTSTE